MSKWMKFHKGLLVPESAIPSVPKQPDNSVFCDSCGKSSNGNRLPWFGGIGWVNHRWVCGHQVTILCNDCTHTIGFCPVCNNGEAYT